jgi:adenylate cyclase
VTHEDDAQRALLAALDMHAELPSLLASLGPAAAHLTIHIGINTGRVIARQAGSEQQSDYAVLGDSVILAQRLESVCPPGQTYVGPTTYELCKEEFAFASVGELTLKGKLNKVAGHRLLGRQATPARRRSDLVGRDQQADQVALLVRDVCNGSGAVAVLTGEPGSGKTRLLAEALERAAERDVGVRSLRCLSYGSALPYWPFADLLRRHVPAGGDPVAHCPRWWCPPRAGSWAGTTGRPIPRPRGARCRRRSSAGWPSRRPTPPLLLVVEDVHWVDAATERLLGEIAEALTDVPLLLLLTARPEGEPAADRIAGRRRLTRVALGPLDPAATTALAAAALGGPPAPRLRALLLARTSGNPLFVEELAVALRESGELVHHRRRLGRGAGGGRRGRAGHAGTRLRGTPGRTAGAQRRPAAGGLGDRAGGAAAAAASRGGGRHGAGAAAAPRRPPAGRGRGRPAGRLPPRAAAGRGVRPAAAPAAA